MIAMASRWKSQGFELLTQAWCQFADSREMESLVSLGRNQQTMTRFGMHGELGAFSDCAPSNRTSRYYFNEGALLPKAI